MVGEITGESIKSAIALKLRSSFAITNGTPSITIYPNIYKEKVIQGMKKPCFFIWVIDVSQKKLMCNNYTRDYQMNIRYHPEEKDSKTYETLSDIGNKLLDKLTLIDVPIFLGRYDSDGEPIEDKKPVRGIQMSFEIKEDVLQFYVTYNIKAKQWIDKVPEMESLEIIQN
ncbi:MAG: DUF6838 family protein [Anaerovoracaceae bacterium]